MSYHPDWVTKEGAVKYFSRNTGANQGCLALTGMRGHANEDRQTFPVDCKVCSVTRVITATVRGHRALEGGRLDAGGRSGQKTLQGGKGREREHGVKC